VKVKLPFLRRRASLRDISEESCAQKKERRVCAPRKSARESDVSKLVGTKRDNEEIKIK
jgi:hypothetical protein